jgi:hypothetical protein
MRLAIAPALVLTLALCGPALAAVPNRSDEERRIAVCIHASARGHAWLERTLRALRDTEGGWIGAAVPNRDDSYDLGPMQVNSWWVPKIAKVLDRSDERVAGWLRTDPCFNVEVARWIFLSSLARARNFWIAVGLYHSRNLDLRTAYARDVWRRYNRRFVQDRMAATHVPASPSAEPLASDMVARARAFRATALISPAARRKLALEGRYQPASRIPMRLARQGAAEEGIGSHARRLEAIDGMGGGIVTDGRRPSGCRGGALSR